MGEDGTCVRCGQFNKLKELAAQVVIQYEELSRKFGENEQQYKAVVARLKEREQQMEQMKKLIEPAIKEYERLKMRYTIEAGCRKEAEVFASRINLQNKELKRQSNMLMTKVKDIDISSLNLDPEVEKDSYKDYTNNLNKTIADLEEKVAGLTTDLQDSKEELVVEQGKYERLMERYELGRKRLKENQDMLKQYQEAMEDLSRVSEEAYKEYEILKNKYELEQKRASDVRIQNEAMKKQSAIFLGNNMSNQQLIEALQEIENLSTQLETQKQEFMQQIEEVKNDISASESPVKVQELEEENTKLSQEKEDLVQKLEDFDKQYKELQSEYEVLEKKLEELKNPPPPPPPPPPPMPSIVKGKGFLSKITRSSKKKPAGAVAGNDTYKQAVDEMMKMISSGRALKKVLKPTGRRENEEDSDDDKLDEKKSDETLKSSPSDSCFEEKPEAMTELNSILHRFKRTHSESDLTLSGQLDFGDGESELAKTFRKVKQAKDNTDSSNVVMRNQTASAKRKDKLSAVEEESSGGKGDTDSVF